MGGSVLFVCPRFHTNHRGWVRELSEAGWQVHAVVAHAELGEDHADVLVTPCEISFLSKLVERIGLFDGENYPNRGPRIVWALRYLRRNRPSMVIIRGRASLLSLVFLFSSRMAGIPVAIYDQEPLFPARPESFVKRLFDRVFFNGGMTPVFGDGEFRRGSRWSLVPFVSSVLPIPIPRSLPARNFVSIGKYNSERKRLDLLVEVLGRTLTRDESVLIIGTSPDGRVPENLRGLASQYENLDIRFLVNVPHSLVPSYLGNSDAFVLAARDEPASVAIVEALASGLFVVCSDTCGTKDYIPPERGLQFRTDDDRDLERAIRALTSSDTLSSNPNQINRWQVRASESKTIVDFVESHARSGWRR